MTNEVCLLHAWCTRMYAGEIMFTVLQIQTLPAVDLFSKLL